MFCQDLNAVSKQKRIQLVWKAVTFLYGKKRFPAVQLVLAQSHLPAFFRSVAPSVPSIYPHKLPRVYRLTRFPNWFVTG